MYLHRLDVPRRSINPALNAVQSKEIARAIQVDLQSIMDNMIVKTGYEKNKKQAERCLYSLHNYLRDAQRYYFVENYKVHEAFVIKSMNKHWLTPEFEGAIFIAHSLLEKGLTHSVPVKRKMPHIRSRRLIREKIKAEYIGVYHLQVAITVWGATAPFYVDLYKDVHRA